jgi:GDP-D-mannose dehydratase
MTCQNILCKECRICKNNELIEIINLGEQIITSRFPIYGDFSTPSIPITLYLCASCSLVQLKYSTDACELYEHEYGYRSGISNTMRDHLKKYQEEIMSKIVLNKGDIIVDIGSNDSTMLQYYDKIYKRIGIDPTGKQFKEFYGDVELIPNYFTRDIFRNSYGDLKPKIISSISMFYDLPDPVQFARDIYEILDDNGIWTCEQSYLITMLRRNSIDTICHEHLEYYSLTAIKYIADMANFNIIDIKFNECNGGSFRIYFSKKISQIYEENTELINKILEDEINYDIKNPEIYKNFLRGCDSEIFKLNKFIDVVNKNEQKIYIYGASTKGNCLLQYARINENKIKYAVERNHNKIGKMTSTGIGIISEETMRCNAPEYLLVLPWHFKYEIIERENKFLENGGQLIFPFPKFEIYSKKEKILITGCDGMIGKYVIEQYKTHSNNYNLYGFSHNLDKNLLDNKITKFNFDIKNVNELELNLNIIKPNSIIHLAGISSSIEAFKNPINTLHLNGLCIANICDIIFKNKWNTKLFNASSSEMFKGHICYNVTDDDNNMYHNHPYSIAKIMGHSIVDFYRNNYSLPFSNGILFTIESKYKKGDFLLNKVVRHAKSWKKDNQVLKLGSLDSVRTILHATDAAKAINLIIEQQHGDNYVICGDESIKILCLVQNIYALNNIPITMIDNSLYSNGKLVAIIENNNKGIDYLPVNISGTALKLKKLGWKQNISINDIITEINLSN